MNPKIKRLIIVLVCVAAVPIVPYYLGVLCNKTPLYHHIIQIEATWEYWALGLMVILHVALMLILLLALYEAIKGISNYIQHG